MSDNEIDNEASSPTLIPEIREESRLIDSPEMIVRDLLKTEKDIAFETLRIMRSRYEKERLEWEKLFGNKERDISDLKNRLEESEGRLKGIRDQLDEEKHRLVEHVREKASEFEAQRLADKNKWDLIGDEVNNFRETSRVTQAKLAGEQERSELLKRQAQKNEKALQERLNSRDEDIAKLKEQILAKEEILLKYRSEKDEEVRLMQESLAALKNIFEHDKLEKGRALDQKEADLESLKKALQETVVQLNSDRKMKEDALEASQKQALRISELEEELKTTARRYESDRAEFSEAFREEQAAWEKYKKDFVAKEEALRKETEEQVTRILKSVGIIEQQLAEEQQSKKAVEEKLKFKDDEIQKLLLQKDEIAIEWRKMLTAEQELRLKRQADILGEFDKVKAAREEDFRTLRAEINNLQAALAEENKLYVLEREQNKQLIQKMAYVEENRQSLIVQLETREKNWREAIASEQELFKKQIEEVASSSESQIKSRDSEVSRLDEDVNMLNGQILELRQKLSLEKNENNNRLDRLSEYETQIKSLTSKYNVERAQWHQKFQFIQQQWEEQRQSLISYQKDVETQYSKDIKGYDERMKLLNEKIRELNNNAGTDSAGPKNTVNASNKPNGKYYPLK